MYNVIASNATLDCNFSNCFNFFFKFKTYSLKFLNFLNLFVHLNDIHPRSKNLNSCLITQKQVQRMKHNEIQILS